MSNSATAGWGWRAWDRVKTALRNAVRGTRANMNTVLSWRPGWRDGAEVGLLASALPLYYLVRGQAQERVSEAVQRGIGVVHFEQKLGIFWEADLQRAVLHYDWFVTALNAFYLYGHLPLIGLLALWLYFWHKPQYLIMRNAFLVSGAIGLAFYLTFPTAPPRLLPPEMHLGFVDTILRQYGTGRPDTPGFFVNEYAAMPSMHFGWNMLVGVSIWSATKNVFVRIFAIVMPFGMFTDIILTANHYILDPILAIPVVATGLAITLAGRWLVLRVLSPDSKAAKDNGLVSWIYWLVGVAPVDSQPPARLEQAA